MSERLDLAEAALRRALGNRLDGLTPSVVRADARQILEAADAGDRPFIERYRTTREWRPDFSEGATFEDVFAEALADGTLVPDVLQAGNLADLAPRVTREMVVGAGLPFNGRFECQICSALLSVTVEGSGSDVVVERHRAWHDRLERLLEAQG